MLFRLLFGRKRYECYDCRYVTNKPHISNRNGLLITVCPECNGFAVYTGRKRLVGGN